VPLAPERYVLLHHQADLQVQSRDRGEPLHRHLEPKRATGYALLPQPSPGDVFFDLEGDPYVGHEGIEYLWGWWSADKGYECAWAHDLDAEKAAFQRFVDRVVALRDEHPGMHVFHYAGNRTIASTPNGRFAEGAGIMFDTFFSAPNTCSAPAPACALVVRNSVVSDNHSTLTNTLPSFAGGQVIGMDANAAASTWAMTSPLRSIARRSAKTQLLPRSRRRAKRHRRRHDSRGQPAGHAKRSDRR
jgi:hypothetical protein